MEDLIEIIRMRMQSSKNLLFPSSKGEKSLVIEQSESVHYKDENHIQTQS